MRYTIPVTVDWLCASFSPNAPTFTAPDDNNLAASTFRQIFTFTSPTNSTIGSPTFMSQLAAKAQLPVRWVLVEEVYVCHASPDVGTHDFLGHRTNETSQVSMVLQSRLDLECVAVLGGETYVGEHAEVTEPTGFPVKVGEFSRHRYSGTMQVRLVIREVGEEEWEKAEEDGARCVCSAEGGDEEVQKEAEKKTEQKEETAGKEGEKK